MQHRPQDGAVEGPPRQSAEQPQIAGTQQRERVPYGGADRAERDQHAGSSVNRAQGRLVHRRVSPSREREGCGDRQCGASRGQGAQGERTVARDEPERQRTAGHRDGPEEDRVEDHEEREQGARRLARAQTGAPESPDRQRRAAHAAGRQQARGRRAAEGHLGARGKTQPRCGAAADEPEQRDVAGEGEQLEQRGPADPRGSASSARPKASAKVRSGPPATTTITAAAATTAARNAARRASARRSNARTGSGAKPAGSSSRANSAGIAPKLRSH